MNPVVIVAIVALVLLMLYLTVWHEKPTKTKGKKLVRMNRGSIYLMDDEGLSRIVKSEIIKDGIHMSLKDMNGSSLGDREIPKARIKVMNPAQRNEVWLDLAIVPETEHLARYLESETKRADTAVLQLNMERANRQSIIDDTVEAIKQSHQAKQPPPYTKK